MRKEKEVTQNDTPKHEFVIPKRSFNAEFLVGLFAIAGVACFAYLAVGIANMSFLDTGTYEVTAEFDNISGLENGAPVEIAGVPVGSVKGIRLNDTLAFVSLSIREDVPLRADDIASIRTKGIIGDRYVRISPGASETKLTSGGVLRDTESTVDIEEVIGKIIHKME